VTRRPAGGRPLYSIDAGGSGTSVCAWNGDRWTMPPLNPSSVGQDASDRHLSELFTRLRSHAGRVPDPDPCPDSARPAAWLASAAINDATAERELGRYAAAAHAAGLRADLVVSNDLTPLLLNASAEAGQVIAVCGTGSGFLATDGKSAPVQVGGCEYLGSDEGSAFDLGLRGLRAAVRGLDGRGPGTALCDLLTARAGVPVAELARGLARLPFPKSRVATLAPIVLQAWRARDPVAAGVVDEAIGELLLGVRAAAAAAALSPGWRLSVTGGVLTGCPEFFALLAERAASLGADPVELICDPAAAVLDALTQVARTDPLCLSDPRINRRVWRVDPSTPDTKRLHAESAI
jgi:N-acetylglucosamine kinase-like BadF-type ATPase